MLPAMTPTDPPTAQTGSPPGPPLLRPALLPAPLLVGFGVALVLSIACILWLDRPVALYVKHDLPRGLYRFFQDITDIGKGNGWFAGGALILILSWMGARLALFAETAAAWRRVAVSSAYFLAAMALSGILVPTFKVLIGRLRPKFLFNEGVYAFHPFTFRMGDVTFPSGHSQIIFAAMLALGFIFPRLRWPFLAFALLIAASRVLTGAHFLGDAVMGSFLGVAGAVVVRRWMARRGWSVRLTGLAR